MRAAAGTWWYGGVMNLRSSEVLLGVLAGGQGRRMGGIDKSQLRTPEGTETLLERLLRIGGDLQFECVVVGGVDRSGVRVLADDPAGTGPIGGLHALLQYAGERSVIALACDMPYVSAALVARLALAQSTAPVLAARDAQVGKWQPWFARYDAPAAIVPLRDAIKRAEHSLQRVFERMAIEEFRLEPAEHALLRDWDEPADVERI